MAKLAGEDIRLVGIDELLTTVDWVGVVHADGNRLGELFRTAPDVLGHNSGTALGQLSDEVREHAEQALRHAPRLRQRGTDSEEPDGATGHRGQVRIVGVVSPTRKQGIYNFGAAGLTIAPLSVPKPSQGLFYVGDLADGTVKPLGNVPDKADYFPDADKRGHRTLRGRKVFPHHQKWTRYDNEKLRQLLRYRAPDGQEEKTSQNATLHG